ncbi:MAG: serpin family protein [Chitinispirillaceae bacterium]|nr:serpin family protein [Chitinispirillaceae bacterium]
MSRYLLIIVTSLVFALIYGCSNPNDTGKLPDTEKQNQPFAVAKSVAVSREESPVPQELLLEQAASNNKFAVKMYKLLCKEDSGNLFFSPYSITAALAMTAAGAPPNSQTRKQILDALQVTLEGYNFDMAINGLDLSLMNYASQTEGITLNIVNSTWMQAGWNFKVKYLDHLSRFYGAGVNLLDFINKAEESRITINNWVAEQTNQKIKDLLPQGSITTDTRLVLTNAIYFLGEWLYSFKPEYTKEKTFTLLNNNIIQVPLMMFDEPSKTIKMLYSQKNDLRAIEFPYKGNRLVMTVFLPDEGKFSDFEKNLEIDTINQLISALDSTELVVALPKFEFTSGSFSLVKPLMELGMIDAFTPAADFSEIDGTRSLFVSDVLHKAFVSVDEKGTEAAAATAVIMTYFSSPTEFIANRPFIFVIRDKLTTTILFMGRVVNPLEKE